MGCNSLGVTLTEAAHSPNVQGLYLIPSCSSRWGETADPVRMCTPALQLRRSQSKVQRWGLSSPVQGKGMPVLCSIKRPLVIAKPRLQGLITNVISLFCKFKVLRETRANSSIQDLKNTKSPSTLFLWFIAKDGHTVCISLPTWTCSLPSPVSGFFLGCPHSPQYI